MLFPGLEKAGLRSLSHGLVSIWLSHSGECTLIASESPRDLVEAIPALSPLCAPPQSCYLKGIVFQDRTAEFQLVSREGELIGESMSLASGVVEDQILGRLVYDTRKHTF